MPSWASVAGVQIQQGYSQDTSPSWLSQVQNVCVVDANAIISGIRFEKLGDAVVSIPEVISEVRDQQSREFLERLPFGIQVMHPETQYLNRIRTFARATGDLQVLSEVDLKLLALGLQLEIHLYGGDSHLRNTPLPARQKGRSRKSVGKRSGQLVGWDYVPNPEEWAEMDKDAAEQTQKNGQQSRICEGVLDLSSSVTLEDSSIHTDEFSFGFDADEKQPQFQQEEEQEEEEEGVYLEVEFELTDQEDSPVQLQIFEVEYQDAEDYSVEDDFEDQLWDILEYEDAEDSDSSQQNTPEEQNPSLEQNTLQIPQESSDDNQEDDQDGWQVAAKSKNSRRRKERKQRRWEKRQSQQQQQQQYQQQQTSSQTTQSQNFSCSDSVGDGASVDNRRVSCITADYAMQNVLLQMGLKLSTPDGRRITQIKKWALRCQTCFMVVKESGRIFCPKCGKATLNKVEVTINSEGVECYGVRKKHCLKGTRFTYPKPKTGRDAKNPITAEDELMLKVQKLRNSSKMKTGKNNNDDMDPFAPEYGEDTWHQMAMIKEGYQELNTTKLNTNWRKNPNTRKFMPRSNRRKR